MELQTIENTNCKVEYLSNGYCSATFYIEERQINQFVAMMNGLTSLFRTLTWKAKTNDDLIHKHIAEKKTDHEKVILAFENDVCRLFQEYSEREQNSRLALSLTVSKIKIQYDFSSYDIVKNCLTKNKLLKKTGFYKSRHKIT